ncbi:hypothetical protein RX327_25025 [Bradyrhizobium sp. BEA-2-5]|uniref:hypothetical protein n=1 Tax=Bradyrhizobium TaxID=374 RepID=UPI000A9DF29F|nr:MULTISPECIES: hypothetical protein [Bradyrhizobium]WOH79152.1 hypothetical protein RX327_25025 [Bradyrhizobium sp. BEA-2-5]
MELAGLGHLIDHYSHRKGGQTWIIEGVAAQGYNVGIAGLISMGESWHNNHHAYPGSAKLGLLPGQIDLGWWLIKAFEAAGLASNIKTPDNLAPRPGLAPRRRTGQRRRGRAATSRPRIVPVIRSRASSVADRTPRSYIRRVGKGRLGLVSPSPFENEGPFGSKSFRTKALVSRLVHEIPTTNTGRYPGAHCVRPCGSQPDEPLRSNTDKGAVHAQPPPHPP